MLCHFTAFCHVKKCSVRHVYSCRNAYLNTRLWHTGQHLERRSHPEGVACVYRFVGAPVEAGLLPHNTPAADPVQLSPTQCLLQATHQTQ